jgi:predicted SAM-dependent methyltransferase
MFVKRAIKRLLPVRLREAIDIANVQYEQARKKESVSVQNCQKIDELLRNRAPIKLEFGSGGNRGIPGWTYVDLVGGCDINCDLSQPFPFPSDSVDCVYSSHLLEHFHYRELLSHLTECFRILKPSGLFSAAVPNAQLYLDGYYGQATFDPEQYCLYKPAYAYNSRIDFVNYIAYMDGCHRYMFDSENIVVILKKCGFSDARLRVFDHSIDLSERQYESLYVSATKQSVAPVSSD